MATYHNNVERSEGRQCRASIYGNFYSNATGAISNSPWKPREVNGISNYPPEYERTPDAFIKNYQEELAKYHGSTSEEKEKMRMFLLHAVLPYMEEVLEANGFASPEILKLLPHLCCLEDSLVNRSALHLVLNVLVKRPCDADDRIQSFIFQMENVLRNSITTEGAIFDVEPLEFQGLRVFVYSRVLIMVVVLIKQGKMRTEAWNKLDSVVHLREKLYALNKQTPFREKKKPRYAVACIHQSIETLKKSNQQKQFCRFLDWLHGYYQDDRVDLTERDKFLKEYIDKVTANKTGWFDFHIVVSCLEPKIHERPKVVDILLMIVEKYCNSKKSRNPLHWLRWSDEAQWQTGLQLGCVLENIVMTNKDDATRKVACGSLCLYVDELKDSKNSTEKLFIEQSLERCCFGPPKTVVPMMVSKLKSRKEEPITVLSSMKFLATLRYRQQMDPQSYQLLCKDSVTGKAFFKGNFREETSITKILVLSDDDQRGNENNPSRSYEDLSKEAYFLRRLNVCPHPNILRVFAFDTCTKPYHIITEYADKGTLLRYLQDARSDIHPLPKPSVLLGMLFGVIEGLMALKKRNLVHQAIMAKNVLVTMDRTCKLTGFKALQEMNFNEESNMYEYISKEDETSIRHAAPEILADGQYSEKSMVFSFGRLLFEVFTYGNTPFNWLKDNETEKIRSLVLRGGTLHQEKCIPNWIWEIIEDCHHYSAGKRPNLAALKYSLDVALSKFESSADDDRPPTEYPPLTHQDTLQSNLTSCYAIDKAEHSRVLGIFGFQTLADDRPEIQNIRGVSQIREKVEKTVEENTRKLKDLSNDHIVKVLAITDFSPTHNAIYSENTERGNLLQLVLSKQCNSIDLVRFLVQILYGLEFLHDSNILHCDIRAENLMVFYDERQGLSVKIARLGRSRYLRTSPIELEMPEDAITRRAPETIKHNTYSISSDVWSFCLLCYELYEAYDSRDQPCQPIDCEPIKCEKENILAYLESDNRPEKPQSMPDWLFIAVKQGLLCKPEERPPPILLRDCLTYRKPFESCLLSRWKKYHTDLIIKHNIDIEVVQPSMPECEHVIPSREHIPFDELEQMSSVAVFMKHSYKYAAGNELAVVDDNEELYEDISLPYVNIGKDIGERRVRDVTYDDVVRQQQLSSQATRPPSTPPPRVVGKPPPRPLKSDHAQGFQNRRPAPYPRRSPLQTLPSNENREKSINDEVMYENIPYAYDMAREMAGQHDDAEERSWHSWNSSTSSPGPSRPPPFQNGSVRGDDPGIG